MLARKAQHKPKEDRDWRKIAGGCAITTSERDDIFPYRETLAAERIAQDGTIDEVLTQLRFLCLDDFGALFLRMPRSMTKTVGRINRPATNFKPVTFG